MSELTDKEKSSTIKIITDFGTLEYMRKLSSDNFFILHSRIVQTMKEVQISVNQKINKTFEEKIVFPNDEWIMIRYNPSITEFSVLLEWDKNKKKDWNNY